MSVTVETGPTNHAISSRTPIGYLELYSLELQSFTNLAQTFNWQRVSEIQLNYFSLTIMYKVSITFYFSVGG